MNMEWDKGHMKIIPVFSEISYKSHKRTQRVLQTLGIFKDRGKFKGPIKIQAQSVFMAGQACFPRKTKH